MNPDEAQAWNNIGSIYLQSGKKRQAFTSFREAVKHARTNWRMWENFLFVSVSLREWQTAIRIFHKLLDLQVETDYENLGIINSDIQDWEVLGILSQVAIAEISRQGPEKKDGLEAAEGEAEVAKFFSPLLDRLLAVKTDYRLWKVAGDFFLASGQTGRAIDAFLSLCRVAQVTGWELEKEKFELVANSHLLLGRAYLQEGSEASKQSARMKLRGLLKKSENNWFAEPSYKEVESLLAQF